MNPEELRTLKFLEELDKQQIQSQRELSQKLNLSLGLVNSFLKRLIQKGYFKAATIPKNRIKYILTPHGVAEKTRLTYEYIQFSLNYYRDTRYKLELLFNDFVTRGSLKIVFWGVSELSEIAYLSLLDMPLKLVAIVDDNNVGQKFFKLEVKSSSELDSLFYNTILITSINNNPNISEILFKKGIPKEKVVKIS